METELLKTVGQIAGIGGLALGVFLVLFREIIRKAIFPTLTRQHAYRLLRLVVVLVWSVALAGIGAWAWTERHPNIQVSKAREKALLLEQALARTQQELEAAQGQEEMHQDLIRSLSEAVNALAGLENQPRAPGLTHENYSLSPINNLNLGKKLLAITQHAKLLIDDFRRCSSTLWLSSEKLALSHK